MGAFYYLGRSVPAGLVRLARLFDVVVILCYRQRCVGQLEAWPPMDRHRVCVADAAVLYSRINATVLSAFHHPQLVTATYGTAFEFCRSRLAARRAASRVAAARHHHLAPPHNLDNLTYLVLEEDYKFLDDNDVGDIEKDLGDFVRRGQWEVIRFGYNPQPWVFEPPEQDQTSPQNRSLGAAAAAPVSALSALGVPFIPPNVKLVDGVASKMANRSSLALGPEAERIVPGDNDTCVDECICERVPGAPGVCLNRGCDVVSTVGQAFSADGARLMTNFFDNMIPTILSHGRCNENIEYMGARRRTCAVDLFLSKGTTLEKVYYHVPGLIVDSTGNVSKAGWKPTMNARMRHFAKVCVA